MLHMLPREMVEMLVYVGRLYYFITLFCINVFWLDGGNSKTSPPKPPGHMLPLGGHMKPMGVTLIGKFSTPQVFYGHFVKASRPIHMKSVLHDALHPGLKWTDDYIRDHYGKEIVRVELGKTEVRSRKADWMRMSKFLDSYPHDDLYLVHSLSGKMLDLVYVPQTLQCGGFQKSIHEAVLWMGKGPLQSVLHYDELDNFLCILDGAKDVILIDQSLGCIFVRVLGRGSGVSQPAGQKATTFLYHIEYFRVSVIRTVLKHGRDLLHKERVEAHGFDQEGRYSHVDVESVDMRAFPQFQDLPWHRAHLAAGDCLYIPYGWYHQVSTFGNRSLAVNIWFSHLWWFDDEHCSQFHSLPFLQPLEKFHFASPNEAVRSQWLEAFEGIDDEVDLSDFLEHVPAVPEKRAKDLFSFIDKDEDGYVTWEELYSFNIDKAILLYTDIFGLEFSHKAANDSKESEEEEGTVSLDSKPEEGKNTALESTTEGEKILPFPESMIKEGKDISLEGKTEEEKDILQESTTEGEEFSFTKEMYKIGESRANENENFHEITAEDNEPVPSTEPPNKDEIEREVEMNVDHISDESNYQDNLSHPVHIEL